MKQLIEYVVDRNLPQVKEEEAACIDVINIAFAHVAEGRVIWEHPEYAEAIRRLRRLNPEMKILLSVGGWGAGGFSEAAYTGEGRRLFAETSMELVERYGLDGIDIDWEYPCMSVAEIGADPADKENFTLLLQELRGAMEAKEPGRYLLSIAAGGDSYFVRNTQMDRAAAYLDYVQIMTYDLRGGFSTAAGHHTSLYATPADLSDACADKAVREFLQAGVPAEKLVIGAAFYARTWTGVCSRDHGLCQMAKSVGTGGHHYGELVEKYINKNGYVRYWDDDAKAPWLFNGDCFISYDDEESLGYKVDYLKEKGLRGIMCWEYGCDTSHTLTAFLRGRLAR